MPNEPTADKPVPRAERVTDYPNDDDWMITLLPGGPAFLVREKGLPMIVPESDRQLFGLLIESAKLREELFEVEQCLSSVGEDLSTTLFEKDEMWANGNRVAAELGLPEGSGVDEVIGRIREIKELSELRLASEQRLQAQILDMAQPFARLKLTQGNVHMDHTESLLRARLDARITSAAAEELKLSSEHTPEKFVEAIRRLKCLNSDGWDRASKAEKKVENLQESYRKWSELYDKILEVLQLDSSAGFDGVVVATREQHEGYQEALQQLSSLGAFIGHPGATPAHVVSETVSLIGKLREILGSPSGAKPIDLLSCAARLCYSKTEWKKRAEEAERNLGELKKAPVRPVKETIALTDLHKAIGLPEGVEFVAVIRQAQVEISVWKQRALAAEAKLADPPLERALVMTHWEKFQDAPDVFQQIEKLASKEVERLKALRDDTNLDRETRRQAAIALLMWDFIMAKDRCVVPPSECLERGLPLLPEDVMETHGRVLVSWAVDGALDEEKVRKVSEFIMGQLPEAAAVKGRRLYSPETDSNCLMVTGGNYEGEVVNSNFCRRIEDSRNSLLTRLSDVLEVVREHAPAVCLSHAFKSADKFLKETLKE